MTAIGITTAAAAAIVAILVWRQPSSPIGAIIIVNALHIIFQIAAFAALH